MAAGASQCQGVAIGSEGSLAASNKSVEIAANWVLSRGAGN